MALKSVRAVVVGATSALGKELVEMLAGAATGTWELTLVDAVDAVQMTSAGDEAAVIVPLAEVSFSGADVAFFAGEADAMMKPGMDALAAGASVVDLTGALAGMPGVQVVTPRLDASKADLSVAGMVPVHPVAWILAALSRRLPALQRMVVTALEPASEAGTPGMDELHKQTVSLLSFQSMDKPVYDAQVAFTIGDSFGTEAKVNLAAKQALIQAQAATALAGRVPFSLELLHAPVFHGYGIAIYAELSPVMSPEAVAAALEGAWFQVQAEDEEASTLAAAGLDEVLVRVRAVQGTLPGISLWLTADNLRQAALNAVACAEELLALRPGATLQ